LRQCHLVPSPTNKLHQILSCRYAHHSLPLRNSDDSKPSLLQIGRNKSSKLVYAVRTVYTFPCVLNVVIASPTFSFPLIDLSDNRFLIIGMSRYPRRPLLAGLMTVR